MMILVGIRPTVGKIKLVWPDVVWCEQSVVQLKVASPNYSTNKPNRWSHIDTRMHSSRMRTARFSGLLSCHARPPPTMHIPQRCMPHLPCMAPAKHAPRHACPPPPLWTEGMTHACENITFPQLLLWTVIAVTMVTFACPDRLWKHHFKPWKTVSYSAEDCCWLVKSQLIRLSHVFEVKLKW